MMNNLAEIDVLDLLEKDDGKFPEEPFVVK